MASRRVRYPAALAAIQLCFLIAVPVAAQPYSLSIGQLKSSSWTRAEGAPRTTIALIETPDGFLWAAGAEGLFRFDGLSFELMDGDIDRAVYGSAHQLMVGHDGSLWVWYAKGWLAVFRQGRLHFIRAPDMGGEVVTLDQTRDGAVWVGVGQVGQPFRRYHRGRWDTIAPNPNREMLRDALEAGDGALWLTYNRSVFRKGPGTDRFERVDIPVSEGMLLATDANGSVWAVGPNGGRRLTGARGLWPGPPSRALHWRSGATRWLAAAFDANGDLWTRGGSGRVRALVGSERAGMTRLEYESGETALAGAGRTTSVLVDRRGNIWFGARQGLTRLSVPDVVVEPEMSAPTKYGDVLFASTSGSVYIGQADAIYRVDPHQRPVRILSTTTETEAICEDGGGGLWIALGDRIMRLLHGRWTTFPRPSADTGVYECGSDPSGRFWLTAATSGMYWLDGSTWRAAAPADRPAGFDPTQRWTDAQGRMWILTDPDHLTRLDGGFVETRSINTSSGLGEIRALFSTPLGLLISGKDGFARMSTTGQQTITGPAATPLRNASGLVQTQRGETWLFRGAGLVRFRTSDLDMAFTDPDFILPERTFDYEEGLPDGPNAQTWRSMIAGGDGRLWLATLSRIAWIDPAHLTSNPTPPGVVITSLTSGTTTIRDPDLVRLRAGASDIAIGFSALSLTLPERVQVRYRLIGHDARWIDPGPRRQAFYTNLAPGTYRFHVIAANEDGVWNRVGDALEFSLPPTFLQSLWFKLLLGAALMGLAWVLYSLRVRQVTAAFEARFQVRTAERERIARELHDTLLQGVQALMLRFQAVSNRLSGDDAAKRELELALERADTVLAEGRSRVRDLRSETARADLAEALLGLAGDLDGADVPPIDIVIEGTARPINPLVGEEMLRIAEEAVRNAVCHAAADRISVVLAFKRRYLALVVSDDGGGVPPDVLECGERPGRYGLKGMRERAERVGGRLTIVTRAKGGCEVSVRVPAPNAYSGNSRFATWLDRLREGGSKAG